MAMLLTTTLIGCGKASSKETSLDTSAEDAVIAPIAVAIIWISNIKRESLYSSYWETCNCNNIL